ncbi:MAG TPA: ferredoxin [Acidimicrobiia bacterium]|nr:ferredoxin [Acidimicrobiia bacterium]
MTYKVKIDPDSCMSTGNCVRRAPQGFAFDEDDVAVPQPGASELGDDELVQIARGCPVGAIHLFAENGTEVDPYG